MNFIKANYNKYHIFALLMISIVVFTLWQYGKKTDFIPCVANCGETFCAELEVSNFKLYGFKYGLLEDHANSNDLDAHPYLYTHNVSIPTIIYPLLEWIGFNALWGKQLFSLFIFALGLFYVYRTTLYYSRSYLIAASMLFFFCTDYYHVFSYGLNALRIWHWLVLFGLLFHAGRYFLERDKSPWFDRLMITIYAVLAFGIGYDFWVISIFVIFTLLAFSFFSSKYMHEGLFVDVFFLGVIFAVPLVLRQIHIANTLGVDFWYQDFMYSVAIKIPFLKDLFTLPPMVDVDAYYTAHNVLRAPATQAPSWINIYTTLTDMIKQVTMPSFGTFSIWNMVLFLTFPILLSLYSIARYILRSIFKNNKILFPDNLSPESLFEFSKGGIKLLFILTIGCVLGLAIFAPFSLHVYLKHQFPLLAAPILLAKSIIFSIAIICFCNLFSVRSKMRWIPLLLVIFILSDHLIIQLDNISYFKPIPTTWIAAVKRHNNASFATSWIPDGAAAYTSNWVVAINPESENKIIKRLQKHKKPFKYSDYFLFGQQDVGNKGQKYLQPDYWLYYPTDQSNQFDVPSPICYRDYLAKFIDSFTQQKPTLASIQSWNSNKFTPGSKIAIIGSIANFEHLNIEKIELLTNGEVFGKTNYNCIYGTFSNISQIPINYSNENLPISVVATFNDGRNSVLGGVSFLNVPGNELRMSQIPPTYLRRNQKSVEEVIAALPNLPVAEHGKDFVIFDLKKYYINTHRAIKKNSKI